VLASVDEISGAKRKQNLTEHADDARISKQLATAKRDLPLELDVSEFARGAARPLPPARGLPRVRAARSAAPAGGGARLGAGGGARAVRRAGAAAPARAPRRRPPAERLPPAEVALAVRPPELPEGALFGDEVQWRFGVRSDQVAEVLVGPCAGPGDVVAALGARPVIAHDAKALGTVPPNLAHDTEVAAYLLEPARRAYPFRELCEERGLAAEVDDQAGADAVLRRRSPPGSARSSAGAGLTDLLDEVELPLVRILRDMEQAGCGWTPSAWRDLTARQGRGRRARARDLRAGRRGVHARLATQLEEILFGKLGLSRKRRGKTGYSTDARVLQAIRSEHEIIPKIERWRELTKLAQTYLDALPAADRRRRPPPHDLQPDGGGDRPAVLQQPEPPEHPDPDAARARDPRLLRRRSPATCWSRRLLAGRAAAAGADRRRGGAQGDLPPRRGRPHRHRDAASSGSRRSRSTRACARRRR
jgi:DNA polymerase-1